MFRDVVVNRDGVRIIAMDSISQIEDTDAGAIVVAGSNGGRESGHVGAAARCAFVVLNDAGVGKDRAGVAGLSILQQAGIPAAVVSHLSAEISDGLDTWTNGIVSEVNTCADELGVRPGDRVRDALVGLTGARR